VDVICPARLTSAGQHMACWDLSAQEAQ